MVGASSICVPIHALNTSEPVISAIARAWVRLHTILRAQGFPWATNDNTTADSSPPDCRRNARTSIAAIVTRTRRPPKSAADNHSLGYSSLSVEISGIASLPYVFQPPPS